MALARVLQSSKGLDNRHDPVTLCREGVCYLAAAYNVDVERRVCRRKGYRKVVDLPGHSPYPYFGGCLFVSNGRLMLLSPDYSYAVLRTGLHDSAMSYATVFNRVYYSNGYENGYVENAESHPWEVGEYVGPDTTRVFSNPPIGHILCLWNGRMFIAEGSTLWYSEPFAYHAYDLSRNFVPFSSRIRMVIGVADGMFVSDEHMTYALVGSSPEDWFVRKVADYPAVEGTALHVESSRIGDGSLPPGMHAMWMSARGICLGGLNGYFRNLTEEHVKCPAGTRGTALIRDGRYITIVW